MSIDLSKNRFAYIDKWSEGESRKQCETDTDGNF
jgi:hypothetical protein